MKRVIKAFWALTVCLMLFTATVVPAFAAGEYAVSVNGGNVFEGSSVSEAVSLAGFSGNTGEITSLSVNGNISGQSGYIKGLSNLSSLTVSGSAIIPNAAFSGMTSLTSVSLSSVQSVGAAAFSGCSSLSRVSLGGVRTIYRNAFSGTAISSLTLGSTPPSLPNGNPFPASLKQITVPSSSEYRAVNDGNTSDNLWYGMAIYAPSEVTAPPPPPATENSQGGEDPQPSGEQPPVEQPSSQQDVSQTREPTTHRTTTGINGETQGVFTVTINTNGGTHFDSIQIPAGELIPPSANEPQREGFTFNGWYKDPELTMLWDFATETVAADMTLYAGWTALEGVTVYKITVAEIQGGKLVPSPAEAIPGETIIVSVVPESGKRLKAGSVTCDGTALGGYTFKMPEHDVIISAEFEDIPKTQEGFLHSRLFKLLAVLAAIVILVTIIVMLAMHERIKKLNSDY